MSSFSADSLRRRSRALTEIRGYFLDLGYVELVTPCVVPSPALEEQLHAFQVGPHYLRTSPEFAIKKRIAAGLHRAFELGPCFRDEEIGDWHRSEFLMLEWYRANGTLADLADEVEALMAAVARSLGVTPPPAFSRVRIPALANQLLGVDLASVDAATLSARDGDDWDAAFFRRWIEDIEPQLPDAAIVFDWPPSQAALAEIQDRGDGRWAQRFEVYLHGVELGNAFLELCDPHELRRRCEQSATRRRESGRSPHPIDRELITATGRLPRTVGIAMGVDRLISTLLGETALNVSV